ncbi:cytidylate kinase-like family protein [Bilifractor porci]|uniref:Cytidylate kinase-like family protein n=1 Tax=Bilifractor porci TaxID=2606636 RepID=A0A7X2P6U8_9FIRM|nr:cytidylate kinase-like family protein [Bilifractor porci]MST81297.1 cytidylate kinase-like family protein [Bilifractor porci]
MENYTVTISRQFGSLGRPIGMKLAELLGIEFYDRDIIEEAARQMDLPLAEASNLEEKERTGLLYMRYPLGKSNIEVKERLYEVENSIIRNWASRKSCVIVGRCSDYILRNEKNHINFFIYAPYDQRVKNCIEDLGFKKEDAMSMIDEVDKARNRYHKRYTHFKQEDLELNQVVIDSSVLGVDGTAEIMADFVKKRFHIN